MLVGRKILKRLGDKTVMSGHVKEYNSPIDGKGESWTLRYENPHMEEGEEDNSDDDEEVNRAELDKLLNLQAVREREFPQVIFPGSAADPRNPLAVAVVAVVGWG